MRISDWSSDVCSSDLNSGERKLMRDPDDKVFGGVCSGLGHYFGIEARWVRLILVLLFIFGGTGLLLYIILWIVMPLARTRADRMAMRGEAPNLQNFKRSFQEEMERSEEHTSELKSLMRISYAVFCLKKKKH